MSALVASLLVSFLLASEASAAEGAYVFMKAERVEHVSEPHEFGYTKLEEFGATKAQFRRWAMANIEGKPEQDVRTYHTWQAPPTVIRPDVEYTTRLTLKTQVLKAENPYGFNAFTGIAINTDRGGPIFTNDQIEKPVRMSGEPGPSGSVEETVPWKVRTGFKNLYISMKGQLAGTGVVEVKYIYDWQDNPNPMATPPTDDPTRGAPTQGEPSSGTESTALNNNNSGAVENWPTAATTFQVNQPSKVTFIMTYHYNGGQGKTPGTISLKHSDGTVYGPWQTSGRDGKGLYWECRPNVVLKPGSYTVVDSDPSTWSCNAASGNRGICEVRTKPAGEESSPTSPTTGMVLRTESRKVKPGETVTIPVWLDRGADLANMNFNVRFDPGVAEAGKVVKGALVPGGTLFEANSGERGVVRVGLAGSRDVAGDGPLAQIPFKVVGQPGQRTPLMLEVTTIGSAADASPAIQTVHGAIEIVEQGAPGDSNGDDVVDAQDALNALKMSVKLIPEKSECDVDDDSQVTSTDARLILKKVVGR